MTETENTFYLSYAVYNNLIKMLSYRHLDLVSGDATNLVGKSTAMILNKADFLQVIQYNGYIILEAKDAADKDRRYPRGMSATCKDLPIKTYILLLDKDSQHVDSAQNFLKLMNHVPTIKHDDRPFNMDILFITYYSLGNNILNKFDDFITPGTLATIGYIRILPYLYDLFTSERMKHKSIPECRILPKPEEKRTLQDLFTERRVFHKMRVIEPVAVWLGAEIGDIIEQKILSEICGIETGIFLVKG
jgi:DNA-directed RNA polymerase subunit H (RpoH/RPB5)